MLAVQVCSFSLYGNPMTHYDENPVSFKHHVNMSMYFLLKMTEIKSTKYYNLIMKL